MDNVDEDFNKNLEISKKNILKDFLDIFILSEFGKPIYCYKKRDDHITLLPLCQALINYYNDTQNDFLKFILTKSGLKISFSVKSPLIIVVINYQNSGLDANLIINQIYAQIVSTITNKTLKSVFEQSATYDLRRLLGTSEKMIDNLVNNGLVSKQIQNLISPLSNQNKYEVFGFLTSTAHSYSNTQRSNVSNILTNIDTNFFKLQSNRVMIPVTTMNQSLRENITNTLISSIASNSKDILYSVLVKFDENKNSSDTHLDETVIKNLVLNDKKEISVNISSEDEENLLINTQNLEHYNKVTNNCCLVTIANQNLKLIKLNVLDVHLLINLISVLKNQLDTVESLWLPICLPRFNNNAFMHAHICTFDLNLDEVKNKFGLILLTTSKEDFDKCQASKNIVFERLSKLPLTSSPLSEINIPLVHAFWYQSIRPQTIVWKSKYCKNKILCINDHVLNYMVKRMIDSNLKTFWLRSDRHYIALLGCHSPSYQLYIQFDVIITKSAALNAAQNIIKWFKKEEEKIILKDYQ